MINTRHWSVMVWVQRCPCRCRMPAWFSRLIRSRHGAWRWRWRLFHAGGMGVDGRRSSHRIWVIDRRVWWIWSRDNCAAISGTRVTLKHADVIIRSDAWWDRRWVWRIWCWHRWGVGCVQVCLLLMLWRMTNTWIAATRRVGVIGWRRRQRSWRWRRHRRDNVAVLWRRRRQKISGVIEVTRKSGRHVDWRLVRLANHRAVMSVNWKT